MFEGFKDSQFTTLAREALEKASEEARRFNHNYVGTEHLLLGLVKTPDAQCLRKLDEASVSPEKVASAVEFIIGRGDRTLLGEIGLTPRAKRCLELALAEAAYERHGSANTTDLLIGLAMEGEGIASGVLASLGITGDMLRTRRVPEPEERVPPLCYPEKIGLTAHEVAIMVSPARFAEFKAWIEGKSIAYCGGCNSYFYSEVDVSAFLRANRK